MDLSKLTTTELEQLLLDIKKTLKDRGKAISISYTDTNGKSHHIIINDNPINLIDLYIPNY